MQVLSMNNQLYRIQNEEKYFPTAGLLTPCFEVMTAINI